MALFSPLVELYDLIWTRVCSVLAEVRMHASKSMKSGIHGLGTFADLKEDFVQWRIPAAIPSQAEHDTADRLSPPGDVYLNVQWYSCQ